MNSGYYQELESKIEGVNPQHALLIENYSSLIESYSSYPPFAIKDVSVEEFVQNNSISGYITSVQIGLAELNISSWINSSFGASVESYKAALAKDYRIDLGEGYRIDMGEDYIKKLGKAYKGLSNEDFLNNMNVADFIRIDEYFTPSKLVGSVDNTDGDCEAPVMAGESIAQDDL